MYVYFATILLNVMKVFALIFFHQSISFDDETQNKKWMCNYLFGYKLISWFKNLFFICYIAMFVVIS